MADALVFLHGATIYRFSHVPRCERVGGHLWEGKELVTIDGAGAILRQFKLYYSRNSSRIDRTLSSFMNRLRSLSTSSLSTVADD